MPIPVRRVAGRKWGGLASGFRMKAIMRITSPLPPISRRVLRDDVQDAIQSRLLDGSYGPGTNLSIEALARELGVSPTPVREALVRMEETGLVTRTALKGYRVAPLLSANAMGELMDTRLVLEVEAVHKTGPRMEEIVPLLADAHARHEAAIDHLDLDDRSADHRITSISEHFNADWAFHQVILDECGNRYVRQLVRSLAPRIHRQRQALGHGLTDALEALNEHHAILEAYRTGDIDAAMEAMRHHLVQVRARAIEEC